MSAQERLLRLLDDIGSTGYYIVDAFRQIEDHIEISHSSLKRYLKDLQDADVLKFNLERKAIMLNPKVFRYPDQTSDNHYIFWSAQYREFSIAA